MQYASALLSAFSCFDLSKMYYFIRTFLFRLFAFLELYGIIYVIEYRPDCAEDL